MGKGWETYTCGSETGSGHFIGKGGGGGTWDLARHYFICSRLPAREKPDPLIVRSAFAARISLQPSCEIWLLDYYRNGPLKKKIQGTLTNSKLQRCSSLWQLHFMYLKKKKIAKKALLYKAQRLQENTG